jgi:hypothetical protein
MGLNTKIGKDEVINDTVKKIADIAHIMSKELRRWKNLGNFEDVLIMLLTLDHLMKVLKVKEGGLEIIQIAAIAAREEAFSVFGEEKLRKIIGDDEWLNQLEQNFPPDSL